jgi:MFS family permease
MDRSTPQGSEVPVARERARAFAAGGTRWSVRFPTFTSLRHRDFLLLWLSNLCNASANWFQQFTIPWLVWDISHSPLWVGIAAGMRSFPFLFIGPLAGVFADRVDRRKLVLVIQTVMAVVVFAFAVAVLQGYVIPQPGHAPHAPTGVNTGVLYATAFTFITGALHALIQPVRQAMVANTVPRRDLWNAIALNSIAGNIARVVGPALGGVIYAWLSPAANFFIQGVLFLLMALLVLPIRLPYREAITAKRASVLADLTQGFRYVASKRVILHLLLLSYIPALFAASIIQMIPVIADRVLAQGPEVGGVLMGAMGVGGIVGTIGFASMGGVANRGGIGLLALTLLSSSILALGLSTRLLGSLVAMFCMGFFRIAFQINNNTLLQSHIPDGLRGRVMALYQLDGGFTPLASMAVGLVASFLPVQLVVVLVGTLSLILALSAFFAYADVRRMTEGQA